MPLLEQAQRNLGTRGRIRTIVIDRGYLDGLVGIEGLTTYDDYGDPQQTRVTRIGASTKGCDREWHLQRGQTSLALRPLSQEN